VISLAFFCTVAEYAVGALLGAHFYVFTVLVQASAWLCDRLNGGSI